MYLIENISCDLLKLSYALGFCETCGCHGGADMIQIFWDVTPVYLELPMFQKNVVLPFSGSSCRQSVTSQKIHLNATARN
jgi:hypothetical protein